MSNYSIYDLTLYLKVTEYFMLIPKWFLNYEIFYSYNFIGGRKQTTFNSTLNIVVIGSKNETQENN